ncbi:MAG: Gfo/Idh/MocA family oxidoreductase [Gemmatimonadales bacterium]
MARDVSIGVIGAGGVAQIVHLPILKRLPDVKVTALIDTQQQTASTIAERFNVPVTARSLAELPEDTPLDAVLVSTPNDTHAAVVRDALSRGKHVLCERPLAPTSKVTQELTRAAEASGLQLMVAMNQRYRLDVRAIRQFVASGELGDVILIRSVWLTRIDRRPRRGWKLDPESAGGGVLMDLGVQALDVALWLLGYPNIERVSASVHPTAGVDDTAVAFFALAGGTALQLEVSWELRDDRDRHELRVLGTLGSAGTSPFGVRTEMEAGLSDVTPPLDVDESGLYTSSYRQEWAEFLRIVRGEMPMEVQVDQVSLMRALEACYRSAREGREVTA